MRTGALAWIDLAGDPVIQRIMLVDAPSVLGWEQWRAMDEGRTVGAMQAMLQAVSDTGRLPAELVEPFSHMILAALDEAAMVVARAPDSRAAVAGRPPRRRGTPQPPPAPLTGRADRWVIRTHHEQALDLIDSRSFLHRSAGGARNLTSRPGRLPGLAGEHGQGGQGDLAPDALVSS